MKLKVKLAICKGREEGRIAPIGERRMQVEQSRPSWLRTRTEQY